MKRVGGPNLTKADKSDAGQDLSGIDKGGGREEIHQDDGQKETMYPNGIPESFYWDEKQWKNHFKVNPSLICNRMIWLRILESLKHCLPYLVNKYRCRLVYFKIKE